MGELIELFQKNQFLTGGVGIAVIGGALYKVKASGLWTWNKLVRMFTESIEVNSDDSDLYREVCDWVWKLKSFESISTIIHSNSGFNVNHHGHDEASASLGNFSPEDGTYFGRIGFSPIWLSTWKTKKEQSGGATYYIKVHKISRKKTYLRDLLEKFSNERSKKNLLRIVVGHSQFSNDTRYVNKRNWDSVYLKEKVKTELERALDGFLEDREKFARTGSPYRLNILLYGPPGTGKSSLAMAIASRLNKTLQYIPADIGERELVSIYSGAQGSVILLEDVDVSSIKTDRKKKDVTQVSLSTILNCLDGALFAEGSITILTTNKKEVLDEALTRSQRINHSFLLDYFSPEDCIPFYMSQVGVDFQTAELKINKAFEGRDLISPADLHEFIRNEVFATK